MSKNLPLLFFFSCLLLDFFGSNFFLLRQGPSVKLSFFFRSEACLWVFSFSFFFKLVACLWSWVFFFFHCFFHSGGLATTFFLFFFLLLGCRIFFFLSLESSCFFPLFLSFLGPCVDIFFFFLLLGSCIFLCLWSLFFFFFEMFILRFLSLLLSRIIVVRNWLSWFLAASSIVLTQIKNYAMVGFNWPQSPNILM